jgi:hypothetical protein
MLSAVTFIRLFVELSSCKNAPQCTVDSHSRATIARILELDKGVTSILTTLEVKSSDAASVGDDDGSPEGKPLG